jgi:uncharacterized membrane protein
MTVVIGITAIAAAAMGGVFFAFSSFVMGALRRMPPAQGMSAMQSINIAAVTPAFMALFLGTALASLVLAIDAVIYWQGAGSAYQLAGTLCYLAGAFIVTIAVNVPLNNALAAADPQSDAGQRLWARYLRVWTAWNHLRAISSLAAGGLLTLACLEFVA